MSRADREVLDVIGIGFGPANIALAIALEELYQDDLTVEFLESRSSPRWQADQLLAGADIQHSPYRDFVTPRNPRSHYTFINFLHEQGRLLKHLNADLHFPLRREYAEYVDWAAKCLGGVCTYDAGVAGVAVVTDEEGGGSGHFLVTTRDGPPRRARSVVVGTGRAPFVPDGFERDLPTGRVFHASSYLTGIDALPRDAPHRFVVVGGSQSAIEILLDLHARFPRALIENPTPSLGYALKDTSPFVEQAFMPAFTDYYYSLDPESRRGVDERLRRSNYGVADQDVIQELVTTMYEDDLRGRSRITLHPFSEVTGSRVPDGGASGPEWRV